MLWVEEPDTEPRVVSMEWAGVRAGELDEVLDIVLPRASVVAKSHCFASVDAVLGLTDALLTLLPVYRYCVSD